MSSVDFLSGASILVLVGTCYTILLVPAFYNHDCKQLQKAGTQHFQVRHHFGRTF